MVNRGNVAEAPGRPRPRGGHRPASSLARCVIALTASWSLIGAGAGLAGDLIDPLATADAFVRTQCLDCHNAADAVAGIDLESLPLPSIDWSAGPTRSSKADPSDADPRRVWEAAWMRIATGQMPPADHQRPTAAEYASAKEALAGVLDRVAREHPDLADSPPLRRLTRSEYQRAIKDLLDVTVDVSQWLPADESSGGFDNITVDELSPALINRYLTAAQAIAKTAVGRRSDVPVGITVRLPPDLTQEDHLEGLPLGTRGGVSFTHTFGQSGRYDVAVRLTRDRDEMIEGLKSPADIDVLVDGHRRHRFHVDPPAADQDDSLLDANLIARIPIDAGTRQIAVTFPSTGHSLIEFKRQPFDAAYNRHRHPRRQPAIFEVSLIGPLPDVDVDVDVDVDSDTAAGGRGADASERASTADSDSPSRRRIFTTWPAGTDRDAMIAAADRILRPIITAAYRRDVDDDDTRVPLEIFAQSIDTYDDFQRGIETSLAAVLVSPHFLFRVASDPRSATASPVDLASRLSFFLWGSLPDDDLRRSASKGELADPAVLRREAARMLVDDRSDHLVTNFAGQWLQLRSLAAFNPDLRLFPDFDDNLRDAFRRETECVFEDVMRRDESVLRLIRRDDTFLNERLAIHYGITTVRGSHFRRVAVDPSSHRGGILRHGSLLAVTSYATRTSPTLRGNWVLTNLIGTPPPPPPPGVPALREVDATVLSTVRDRLAAHRDDPACASCHGLIDPTGFALEHFDAVGRWRQFQDGMPIDAGGILPDGTEVTGVDGLEQNLVDRPDMFAYVLTERLMTFALGRVTDHRDAASIRSIVRDAAAEDYRFSALIRGIVCSPPFLHGSSP